MEVLCLQEVLSQCKHIDPQFVVFLSVDTGGDDFEDFVPKVNNRGLGAADKHIKDEALRRVFIPVVVVFFHLEEESFELLGEEVRRVF